MKAKFSVLIFSILGLVLNMVVYNPRYFGLCQESCGSYIDKYQDMTMIFPYLLFFSVMACFLKPEIFTFWWRFTKISLPIIIILYFLISLELHHSPGGFMNFDHAIDYYSYQMLNLVYSVGSFIAIYRGYKQNKVSGSISDKRVDVRPVN